VSAADEVRARLDIVDVVGDYVPLKRAGRIYKGLCPFHDERTPSFTVFPDSGNWRCFGACAIGGDAFDFVMRIENVDFRRALEILARRVGVELEPPSPAAAARQETQERLREACSQALDQYHRLLLRSPAAAAARDYLKGRGFDTAVAQSFQLGWSPPDGRFLCGQLLAAGFTERELLDAGLAREREGGGGVYDTFRGRLMIPIHDATGKAIGFGARTLEAGGIPKYLNSPQGPLFDKSHTLFGLHRAAREIRAGGVAVVVEGYTDVIRAHTAGFANVVASLGTAITEHQVRLLSSYATSIVLALDADAAGQAATLRGLEVARQAAVGQALPQPTGRGGVRYHARASVELKVARLPSGMDPDDVLRTDPQGWRQMIEGARPVLEHLFGALTADLNLADPSHKSQAADRLLPVVAGIGDPVSRRAWLGSLAIRLGLDERILEARLADLAAAMARAPRPRSAAGAADEGASSRPRPPTCRAGRRSPPAAGRPTGAVHDTARGTGGRRPFRRRRAAGMGLAGHALGRGFQRAGGRRRRGAGSDGHGLDPGGHGDGRAHHGPLHDGASPGPTLHRRLARRPGHLDPRAAAGGALAPGRPGRRPGPGCPAALGAGRLRRRRRTGPDGRPGPRRPRRTRAGVSLGRPVRAPGRPGPGAGPAGRHPTSPG
jgi:DNA primase